MYYSLVNNSKHVLLTFFAYLFDEYKREKLKFLNMQPDGSGGDKITFTKVPQVIESYKWDQQTHPAVLIDTAVGNLTTLSINKDFSFMAGSGRRNFGGASLLSNTISCIAKTKEERDNLVDICAIYLSRPDTKDFFTRFGIDIPNPVSLTGESTISTPNTDFELYQTDLTLDMHVQWEEYVDPDFKIEEIILRVGWDLDPPEGKEVLVKEVDGDGAEKRIL